MVKAVDGALYPASVVCDACVLRLWRIEDREALIVHAGSPEISRNLWDSFPHPYMASDADEFLGQFAAPNHREGLWAIDVGGEAIGSLSIMRGSDVESLSAEIGYWIGERYWGRGIATSAVRAASRVAFQNANLVRLFAPVYAWNAASMRVLEKADFQREGVLRRSAVKGGIVIDRVMYAKVVANGLPYVPAG